jgi:hypothetical protein
LCLERNFVLEPARVKEGCYDGTFRRQLQIFDVKTAADAVQDCVRYMKSEENAGDEKDMNRHCETAARALKTLAQQWPSPYTSTLKLTGMVKILKQCCSTSATATLIKYPDSWCMKPLGGKMSGLVLLTIP